MAYPPRTVAERLHISPATLRKWSVEFAPCLSLTARAPQAVGRTPQRAYTDGDLAVLRQIQLRLDSGLTYAEVRGDLILAAQESAEPCSTASPPSDPYPAIVALQASHRATIAAKDEVIATQRQALDALAATLADLRQVQAAAAAAHAQERDQLAATITALQTTVDQLAAENQTLREGGGVRRGLFQRG